LLRSIGAPGLNITESTIKLAQQNYGEHFKALNAIAKTFSPDIIFPLMDLRLRQMPSVVIHFFQKKRVPQL